VSQRSHIPNDDVQMRTCIRDLEQLIEGDLDGFLVTCGDEILSASPAAATALGHRDPKELAGRSAHELFELEDRESARADVRQGLSGGKIAEPRAYRCVRSDGRTVLLDVWTVRMEHEGLPVALLAIRDRQRQEERKARLAATDRLASIGLLLAEVAHEISNPLTSVSLSLTQAQRLLASEHSASEAVLAAQLRLERAAQGLDRVLDIATNLGAVSARSEQAVGPINVHIALESAINLASHQIRRRAELVRRYGEVPPALADETRLSQVLLNLLTNAAQALPLGAVAGNRIVAQTRLDTEGRVVIEISDSGIGIPEEYLDRVFEPFFTTKPPGVGTGLGLAICKDIVADFGGALTITSHVGRGTCARVVLSPASFGLAAGAVAPMRDEYASERGRICLVDDDPAVTASLADLLGTTHEVVTADTPEQALDIIRGGESDFDVIFCDVSMREARTLRFYDALCRDYSHLATRTVFTTTGDVPQWARDLLDSAPNPVLTKPLDATALLALVEECVRLRGSS
jgi:PAS domain S-box-containing protein